MSTFYPPYPDDPDDSALPPGPIERYMTSPEILDPKLGPAILDQLDQGRSVMLLTVVKHDDMSDEQLSAIARQTGDEIAEQLPELVREAAVELLGGVPRGTLLWSIGLTFAAQLVLYLLAR